MLLKVGDRVKLSGWFPIGSGELNLSGHVGTVVEIDHHSLTKHPKDWNPRKGYIEFVRVHLDRHVPALNDWDNDLYFGRDEMLADAIQMMTRI